MIIVVAVFYDSFERLSTTDFGFWLIEILIRCKKKNNVPIKTRARTHTHKRTHIKTIEHWRDQHLYIYTFRCTIGSIDGAGSLLHVLTVRGILSHCLWRTRRSLNVVVVFRLATVFVSDVNEKCTDNVRQWSHTTIFMHSIHKRWMYLCAHIYGSWGAIWVQGDAQLHISFSFSNGRSKWDFKSKTQIPFLAIADWKSSSSAGVSGRLIRLLIE